MTNFVKKQQYDTPAANVWDLIGDFYSIETWMSGVTDVVPDHGQRTRTVTMHDGGRLVEQLLEEGSRFYSYRFVDPGPVPVRDFSARITVVPVNSKQSEIEWEASFEPLPGVNAEDAIAAVGGFYQACLDKVAAKLGA